VRQHVQECDTCQLNKGEYVLSPGLLASLPILDGAWKIVTIDFICGLPRSEGKDVILVIIDKLTKYCHLVVMSHLFKTAQVATMFLDIICKLHSLPYKIIIDRDSIFTIHFWKKLIERWGIELNFSTSYYPQIDGQIKKIKSLCGELSQVHNLQ
jgi:Integrase core domain